MKYTWQGQILSVIVTHIEAAFLFFVVWMIAIGVTGTHMGGLIYSIISAIFYGIMMYSQGYAIEKNDKKNYSKLNPIWYKGAVVALGLVLLNGLVLLLYKFAWTAGSDGEALVKLWAVIGNVACLFWFSPYMNLLGLESGNMAFYGYAVIILFHTLMCFLGYFAGYKNFDISAKLKFLVYEKKK